MERLLALIGSGEMSHALLPLHREVMRRLDARSLALLDSPFGFQENADSLCAKATEFFAEHFQASLALASLRRLGEPAAVAAAAAATVGREPVVFSGPGSPTYALEVWRDSPVPAVLREKLELGGAIVFASAAAATLGDYVMPVYEIYKAGRDPHWLPGLGILREVGLRAAVVPHYDNAEGGTHDTRFCFIGERRFALLVAALPPGVGILGLDEHTAVLIDAGSGTLTVHGRGKVTWKLGDRQVEMGPGERIAISQLPHRRSATPAVPRSEAVGAGAVEADAGRELRQALQGDDVQAIVAAAAELTRALPRSGGGTELLQRAIAGLGETAASHRRALEQFSGAVIGSLLELRDRSREDGNYALADELREILTRCGVEVRDQPGGAQWQLAGIGPGRSSDTP